MDILTDRELDDLISDSELTDKYNESINRESAEELLQEKIKQAHEDDIKEKAQTERAKASRSRSTRSRNRQNPIIKVLTSASFIRGVMGILGKALK
jgi:hypothetical protein